MTRTSDLTKLARYLRELFVGLIDADIGRSRAWDLACHLAEEMPSFRTAPPAERVVFLLETRPDLYIAVLERLGSPTREEVMPLLTHHDPEVRAEAMRLLSEMT